MLQLMSIKAAEKKRCLYDNETLETLILKACVILKGPYKVCLKSLKTLHLHAVNITDRAWVLKFLSGSPNLEDLLILTASNFHQLVHLDLFTRRGLRWVLLTFMIDSSPKLQVLKLIY
ncbi:unnamed protein product, partial [Eruca vesicaria subsp. sativa]|nr:unnamed protein product [Eruca vesicaria subsp. sativa]